MLDLNKTLETAVNIAREAGALIMEGFWQDNLIKSKSSSIDWVTEYDEAAEKLISKRLRQAFPDHGQVGEEGAQVSGTGEYTWYIDPIDGTTNYAHGFPIFSVSLGLYAGNEPIVGVVLNPYMDECYTAVTGQGAYLTHAGKRRRLQVSQSETLVKSLLGTGFPYDRFDSPQDNIAEVTAFVKRAHGIRRAGSAALDMAYVAAGRFDGYWEYKLHVWDAAAAVLLVQEAGGRVSFMDGRPYAPEARLNLVVSNGRIHQQMLDVLR